MPIQDKTLALDFQSALKATSGNEQLAHKLLAIFITQLADYQSDITNYLSSNNLIELQNRIHKLNSASQYIGSPSLRQLVSELDGQIEPLSQQPNNALSVKIESVIALIKKIRIEEKYSS